jgi:hypothetical protein
MRVSRSMFTGTTLSIVVCAASVGCQRSAELVPVEGKVTLNNKPLADATVLLSPTQANGPGPFMGVTDQEGRYAIGPVDRAGAGAAADTYQLMITTAKPDPNNPDGPPLKKELVPPKYRDGSERFSVPEEGTDAANFDIQGS